MAERDDERATAAVADLSAAVGAGRTAWGWLPQADIVLLLREDIVGESEHVIDLGGGETLIITIKEGK